MPVVRPLWSLARASAAWLYPDRCLLCEAAPGLLCPDCRALLPVLKLGCSRCAIALPQPGICGTCQQHPPAFTHATALFGYQPPLIQLIHRFKYYQQLSVGRLLGGLLAEGLAARLTPPYPELLLPVPLHWTRLWQRGFNQALELAHPVARQLGIPVRWDCLRRIRATPPQRGLSSAVRRQNVRGAFTVTRPLAVQHVALVDDVLTTGQTAAEIAVTLRQAGVARVDVYALART